MRRALLALVALASVVALAAPASAALPDEAKGDGRPLSAVLTGSAAVTDGGVLEQGDLDGSGLGAVTVDVAAARVCFDLAVAGIDPATEAHIHQAPAGRNGPVVATLVAPSATSSGCVTVDAALASSIATSPTAFYVDVHNAAFPNGALRGQLAAGGRPQVASMSGAAEVNTVGVFRRGDPDGVGRALVWVNRTQDVVCAEITTRRVDPALAAEIQRGAFGTNGTVVVTLPTPGPDGASVGCVAVSGPLAEELANTPGSFYVNVITAGYPDGAVRGQLTDAAAGYRLLSASGEVTGFGSADIVQISSVTPGGSLQLTAPAVDMAATPSLDGYWIATRDGGVASFGDAPFRGSALGGSARPFVGIAPTPSASGYWLATDTGEVFNFGDALALGSLSSIRLNQPIVGIAATPTGNGFWLVASDGGVFSFGDARFFGSTGDIHLNQPIVAMQSTAFGDGYWLVASDGGVFSFGDAAFYGSTGDIRLNRPVVGMQGSPTGGGYRLVASDGGVFSFGDVEFFGALATPPVVAIAP